MPDSPLTRSAPAAGGWIALASALLGCPQLLDDSFDTETRSQIGDPDGGLGLGGAVFTGGGAGGAQQGGSSSGDGGVGGAGSGGSLDPPDGGTAGADGGTAGAGGSSAGSSSSDAAPPSLEDALSSALAHRYRFDLAGSEIDDSVGDADGSTNALVTAGAGRIDLDADSGHFVDLPNGLVSSLSSVTLEAWVDWQTPPGSVEGDWEPIFSFGTSDLGEDQAGLGTQYLTLQAQAGDAPQTLAASYSLAGYFNETKVRGGAPLPSAENPERGTHVALVVDDAANVISLYVEGALEASSDPAGQNVNLSAIADQNNWIGRGQYAEGGTFDGGVLEFRIYARALSAQEVSLSHSLGPDADF